MPQLPKSRRTVSLPAGTPNVQVGAGFGQEGPRAIGQAGRALEGVSNMLFARQDKIDTSMIISKMADYKEFLRQRRMAEYEKKGEQSLNLYNENQEWLPKAKADFAKTLPSRIQQRFTDASVTADNTFFERIASYQATETSNYHKSSYGKAFESWRNEIYELPTDNDLYKKNVAKAHAVIDQNFGGDNAMKEVAEEQLLKARLDSLVRQNNLISLDLTEEYFNEMDLPKEIKDIYGPQFKTRRNQLEREQEIKKDEVIEKQKDLDEIEHDRQEDLLGDAYKNKDYSEAYRLLLEADQLGGDEERVWSNAINGAAKGGEEASRWLTTDKQIEADIINNLDEMSEDEIRAYMGNGLSVADTNKYVGKKKRPSEDEVKLKTPQSKQAMDTLKLAMERAMFLPDVDAEDEITDKEAIELRTLHANAVDEYKKRYLDPDNKKNPQDIVKDILAPYMEEKSNGFWSKVVSFFTEGVDISGGLKREQLQQSAVEEDPNRQQAIDILESNGKLVNEETIKQVMGQL